MLVCFDDFQQPSLQFCVKLPKNIPSGLSCKTGNVVYWSLRLMAMPKHGSHLQSKLIGWLRV